MKAWPFPTRDSGAVAQTARGTASLQPSLQRDETVQEAPVVPQGIAQDLGVGVAAVPRSAQARVAFLDLRDERVDGFGHEIRGRGNGPPGIVHEVGLDREPALLELGGAGGRRCDRGRALVIRSGARGGRIGQLGSGAWGAGAAQLGPGIRGDVGARELAVLVADRRPGIGALASGRTGDAGSTAGAPA